MTRPPAPGDVPDGTAPRATAWVAAGSAVNGLAAFLFQLLSTRALGPDAYAPISVLWTLQYLWIAVAVTALEAYVTRMVTLDGPASVELQRFVRLVARWLVGAAVLAATLTWALRGPLFAGTTELAISLGLLVGAYGWYGVVRGRAAGVGRFRAYGLATAGESVIRLVAAAAVLAVVATTTSLSWVFPLGPLAVAAWAWGRRHPTGGAPPLARTDSERRELDDHGRRRIATRFLLATSGANASVQFLIAGGPLVLLPLGADAVTVSVFFTTVTAARVPMTFALNGGLSRLLPPLTRMARADDGAGLRRAAGRTVAAIAGTSLVAAAGAAAVGPEVIALLFGEGFRPDRGFVTVTAVSTVLAVGGLLLGQSYIATDRERRLPVVWTSALAIAGVLVLTLPLDPTMRVAVAFAVATGAAVVALSAPLLRRP